jgi:hypothetical protein
MDSFAEQLDSKLREWKPETADVAQQRIAEIIAASDRGALDLYVLRSRPVEKHMATWIFTETCTSTPVYRIKAPTFEEAIAKYWGDGGELISEEVEDNYLLSITDENGSDVEIPVRK